MNYRFDPENPCALEYQARKSHVCGGNEVWVKGRFRFLVDPRTRRLLNATRDMRTKETPRESRP